MAFQVRAKWEQGCRDKTEHDGARPRISQGPTTVLLGEGEAEVQTTSWAMPSSMSFILETRQE